MTQTILNVFLNIMNYKYGYLAYIANYIWVEVAVIMIESVIYVNILSNKIPINKNKGFILLYTFVANIVSFIIGILLSYQLPTIF